MSNALMTALEREDALRFLDALCGGVLPEPERLILCGFPGDPDSAPTISWRPRPWRPGRDVVLNDNDNAYATVSSFFRAGDGSFRRRNETFAAGRALMVDDVGTKVPREKMLNRHGDPILEPSAIVQTSPGNFQWWYFLREPERDVVRFDAVIRAFIAGRLLGVDPGMSGVTRVGRIPGYLNSKPKYHTKDAPRGFRVRLESLTKQRYSIDELLGNFELRLNGQRSFRPKLITSEAIERNRAFSNIYIFLRGQGMLKRASPDPSGWTEMRCPWTEEHTGSADTGAAIREPADENDYYGAFRCHHGHCIDKGWAELLEWVGETAAAQLDEANDAAIRRPELPPSVTGAGA